jgi:hypothetical protein
MRSKLALLILAVVAVLSPAAVRGQGLVSIQNYSGDFRNEQPLSLSVTGNTGYDMLKYKAPSSQYSNIESAYAQIGAGTSYTHADRTTPYSFSLEGSVLQYVKGIPTYGSTFYNGRATFNIEHQFSERLKMSNNFYLTYGTNPSSAFGYGATSALWNGLRVDTAILDHNLLHVRRHRLSKQAGCQFAEPLFASARAAICL